MPTVSLPENPSVEHLKSQAKFVRDLIRAGDPGGLSMVDEFHPRFDAPDLAGEIRSQFKTADAQLIIAHLYGFRSWTKLRDHVLLRNAITFTPSPERPDSTDESRSFVVNACLDYAEDGPPPEDRIAAAQRMYEADPSVASGSVEALATVGNHCDLGELLDERPAVVNQPCGPNGWPPLLYATYSRFTTDNTDWSATDTVRLLLDRGADPNAGFLWRGLVPPFTALTGAFGGGESRQAWHSERLDMARLLLDAGADPNDGQALYNNGIGGQNHDDPAHLELLVTYGLGTQKNGPWYRQLGDQLRDPTELLYNELEAAVKRNRPKILRYLMSLGLDLERPVGRSQLTPARIAAAEDHGQILEILGDAGLDTALTPTELALRYSRTNQAAKLRELVPGTPGLVDELRRDRAGLCKNVSAGHDEMLGYLIELGFDINDRSDTKTGLHHAAEANDTPLAQLLIQHGCDPNLVDTHIGATPWGWANHFHQTEVGDYLRPFTSDGDPLTEITVRHRSGVRVLATPALIERLIDQIHEASEPVLVKLSAGKGALTIGLGHPGYSVALFLDADEVPWHATEENTLPPEEALSFSDQMTTREFSGRAHITVETARQLASAFIADTAFRPAATVWQREQTSEPSDD